MAWRCECMTESNQRRVILHDVCVGRCWGLPVFICLPWCALCGPLFLCMCTCVCGCVPLQADVARQLQDIRHPRSPRAPYWAALLMEAAEPGFELPASAALSAGGSTASTASAAAEAGGLTADGGNLTRRGWPAGGLPTNVTTFAALVRA